MPIPVFTPGGISDAFGSFNGYVSNQFVPWPAGSWVFSHAMGSGLAVFHGITGAALFSGTLDDSLSSCTALTAPLLTHVCAGSLCSCGVPWWTLIGPSDPTYGCLGTDYTVPNVQGSGAITINTNLEAIGFTVAPDNLVSTAQASFIAGAPPGPLSIGSVTFPMGPAPGYPSGTNLGGDPVGGGQLYMMKFTDPSDGSALYVAIVAGATAGLQLPFAEGWTLVMGGTSISDDMWVFVYGTSPLPSVCPSDVVTDICERAGLDASQINVALLQAPGNIFGPTGQASDQVQGYVIERPTSAADCLKVLMQAYFFDACETNGQMLFVPRGLAPKLTIPEADLGLVGDKGKLQEQFDQEQDLPSRYSVTYVDPLYLYQQGKQDKLRNSRILSTKQEVILNIPMVMDSTWAEQVAEKTLFIAWLERQHFEFNLGRASYLLLDPTDVIEFVYEGLTFTMRIVENSLGRGLAIQLKGVNENTKNYLSSAQGAVQPAIGGSIGPGAGNAKTPQSVAPTFLYLFDIPLLEDSDANPGGTGKYVALASPQSLAWPGAALFISSDNASFAQEGPTQSKDPAYGETTGTLGLPASPFTWDDVNTFTVDLSSGSFASDTDENVLNGSNMLVVGQEILQFGTAVQNSDGSWTLSHLLRGRRGTEWACGFWGDFPNGINTHQAGELVVAASAPGVAIGQAGMFRVDEPLALLNALRYYRGVTLGQDLTTAISQSFSITGRDLMPYAPVKVGGAFDGSGNMVMTWERRTRIGGDGWGEGGDNLPLSEDSELYDVDILNGAGTSVLRTLSGLTTPTAVYTAAQQIADFGSAQASYIVNVYQRSAQVGRGFQGHGVVPAVNGIAPVYPSSGSFYVNGT